MVISRLEEETASSREECERAAEARVKRIRDKYETELREVERSERQTLEKFNTMKVSHKLIYISILYTAMAMSYSVCGVRVSALGRSSLEWKFTCDSILFYSIFMPFMILDREKVNSHGYCKYQYCKLLYVFCV